RKLSKLFFHRRLRLAVFLFALILQKIVYMKNREEEWKSIIVKNAILLIIAPFYFLIIVKNGVLSKIKK
ncbi:hypothetical protein, partial [Streptococcus pneumoniae]|uniref:hypothetical protein n=1 Tax=Streptococcus pneumoniae TaxID=1313 RepID=UPI000A0338B2